MSSAEGQFDAGDDEVVQCHPAEHIAPDSVAFSPDDKLISYLVTPESAMASHVFVFNLPQKEQRFLMKLPVGEVEEEEEEGVVSPTEGKRRKSSGERGLGFTRYEWAQGPSGPMLMVPLPGGVYVQDEGTTELRRRVASTALCPVLGPQLSPDGRSIAYVRDDEIYVIPTSGGEEIQITSGARGTGKTHGIADGLGQGEAEKRSGFWWSLDSKHIAFSEVDATGVRSSPTVHQGENVADCQANVADPSATEAKRSLVRLGKIPATGGEVSWVQLLIGGTEHNDEECLARVVWLPDGYLIAEIQNLARTNLKVLKFNPTSGQRQVLLEERVTTPSLSDCFTPLKTGGFIWASERSGFRHLYLYDAAGECLGPLTSGDWTVEQVAGVDENVGIIYFMGNSGHHETHLYSTLIFPDHSFPIAHPKQLTRGQGIHAVVLDHQKENFVDILYGVDHTPPRVQVCSLANRRVISPQMPVTPVPNPEPTSTQEFHTVTPQPPRHDFGLDDTAREELQKAAAILLKHTSVLCEGLCRGCVPVLEQLLTQLALFDSPETTMSHSLIEDDRTGHSEVEDENEAPSADTNGNHRDAVSEAHVGEYPQPGTVDGTGSLDDPVAPDTNGNHDDRVSPGDHLQPGTENSTGDVDDTASGGVTPVSDRCSAGAVSPRDKARLWSEEQSSGSDEEQPAPLEDARTGEPEPTDVRGPKEVPGRILSTPNYARALAFHSPNAISNFAWANANLPSPNQPGDVESPKSFTPEGNGKSEWPSLSLSPSPSPSPKISRSAQEALRMKGVLRKKDFECIERMRGKLTNVVEGLELHSKVFNNVEQQKLIDMVYRYQELGRQGKLRAETHPGRTYSEPKKWMPGKGRITIQFGCCYNYAIDKNGNPPGITEEHVDPLPDLLKTTIRRLVRWGVLDEKVVPDSCIINIYDVGDCIPPHIDHHDFVRPFSTLSLLSECNILFGSKLSIVGEGQFDGPMSLPLPTGSVLVLKGNSADVAKHCVPGVPTKRISITFRKMDPSKAPSWYELPTDLKGIRTAPHLR